MEATGTPPPAAPQPPPPTGAAEERKAGVGWRILAVIVGLIFALFGVAFVIAAVDIGDAPLCEDAREDPALLLGGEECYDGSSTQKTIDLVTGWPLGILAILVLPLAIYFAATGRNARILIGAAGASLALLGINLLLTNV
jgi:hypothetical protein